MKRANIKLKRLEIEMKSRKKALFLILTIVTLCLIANSALATSGSGGGLPYEGALDKIKASITGPFAATASMVGVVGTGATLILGGELNAFLRSLIFLVMVISLIVAANNIVSMVTGSGSTVCAIIPMAISWS
jgi:type IV secretion system protein VirB2